MNHIYRLVLNRALGLIQVTSELGSHGGKTRGYTTPTDAKRRRLEHKSPIRPISAAIMLALGVCVTGLPATAAATTITGTPGQSGGNALLSTTGGTGGTGAVTSGAYADSGGAGGNAGSNGSAGQGAGGSGGQGGNRTSVTLGGSGGVGGGNGGFAFLGGGGGGGGGGLSNGGNGGGGGGAYGDGGYGGGGGGGGGDLGSTFNASTTVTTGNSYVGGRGGSGGIDAGVGGGAGGGGAGALLTAGTLTNQGNLTGGAGGYGVGESGGGGGALLMDSGTALLNSGSVTGGAGGQHGDAMGGGGGDGIAVATGGAMITNYSAGVIIGGAAGYCDNSISCEGSYVGAQGGAGLQAQGNLRLKNAGKIQGGHGGAGNFVEDNGGNGGAALLISGTGNSGTNSGTLIGGGGGAGGSASTSTTYPGGNGGQGGSGADLSGITLTNTGTIQGGNGGTPGAGTGGGPNGTPGIGGTGVIARGNVTLIDSGTLSGGLANGGSGTQADAIDLTSGSNTLTLVGTSWKLNGNINVATGASLRFNQSTPQILTNKITGSGSVTQDGTGTLILNAANTYTGATTVSAGTLEIGDASHTGASITSAVTVGSGGTLRGHGTINGNVTNNGILFPGGSIGVTTINGNFTQNAGGTLKIEVTPTGGASAAGTGYDQLNVTGSATLAGNLAVQVDSGTYTVGTQYDIVKAAGGVSGQFNKTLYNPAFAAYITPKVTYGTNDVLLTLNPTPSAGGGTGPAFTTGQGGAISTWAAQESLLSSEETVLNSQGGTGGQILSVNGQPDPAVWVRTLGGSGQADGANLHDTVYLIGFGDEVKPGLIIGGAYGHTQAKTSTDTQTVKTKANGLYLYSLFNRGPLYIDGTLTAGALKTDSRRSLPPTTLTATGSAGGRYEGLSLKAGYRLTPTKQVFVTPYIGAGYLHTHRNAFTETGAGSLNLTYASTNSHIGTYSAGARIGTDVHPAPHLVVSPWLSLGGIAYSGDRNENLNVSLGSQQQTLSASGTPSSAGVVNAGIALMSEANWSGQLVYRGQFSAHTHMNTADLKVVYRW